MADFRAGLVAVILLAAGGVARADEAALKKEIDALKKEVEALKKDVEALKGGGVKTKASLTARFEAAKALSSVEEEQKAYAVLAVEAARIGEVDLTNQAISKLRSVEAEQQAMYKAALFLAKAGKEQEALTLAKKIRSREMEQKALSKIARGEVDE